MAQPLGLTSPEDATNIFPTLTKPWLASFVFVFPFQRKSGWRAAAAEGTRTRKSIVKDEYTDELLLFATEAQLVGRAAVSFREERKLLGKRAAKRRRVATARAANTPPNLFRSICQKKSKTMK